MPGALPAGAYAGGWSDVTPRRTPNFFRFIVTGAIVGFLIGALIAWTGIFEDQSAAAARSYVYGTSSGVGLMGLFGAGLGAMLAAVVAVLLDRTKDAG